MTFVYPPIAQLHNSHPASGSAIDNVLDAETVSLIAQLALDDLAEILGSRKGKGRADSLPVDEEISYQLQSEQFNEWLSIAEDAKFAKSMDNALVTDAAYLDILVTAEEAAAEDRIAAELLSRGEALPAPKSCQMRLEHPAFTMDPVFITALDAPNHGVQNGLLNDETMDNESTFAGSIEGELQSLLSSIASKSVGKLPVAGPSADRNKRVNCAICYDSYRYSNMLNAPCGHYYCRDCLIAFVEVFTRDESLFPLRCCQKPIPVPEVLPILSLELRTLFEQKCTEFCVPSEHRLYCSNPNCSAFLGSTLNGQLSLESGIECPRCAVNTCPKCKESAHPGERCGVRASNEAFKALTKHQKWQTCPGCNAVVELNLGCYHMTCRCGTQFCYLCAARWKTCGCPKSY